MTIKQHFLCVYNINKNIKSSLEQFHYFGIPSMMWNDGLSWLSKHLRGHVIPSACNLWKKGPLSSMTSAVWLFWFLSYVENRI